jgi:hypothetical protein
MKRACNLLIYRALEASVKKYADTIGKPCSANQIEDYQCEYQYEK